MLKKALFFVFFILVIVGVIYLAILFLDGKNDGNIPLLPAKPGQQFPDVDYKNVDPEPISDPILEEISNMSLEEKVGQLVIVGIEGYDNDLNTKKFIEEYHISGFILFQRNIKDTNQMISLINSLKETNLTNEIPLFLAIDEEGGRVSRLPGEFLKIPSSEVIGRLNISYLSYELGNIVGEQLKSFGLNMNFAPVLDISSNPDNPVIGDRSFGNDPKLVSDLGIQTMKGLQDQSIISVVKHFPGHGDTEVDSHLGLPVLMHDLNRLKNFELIPFKAAIENHVDAIMMAHILLPQIDNHNPSTFSPKIISELLREQMGFDGVVITDDLTMGAIVKNYNIGEAAVKSIKAGSDLVLVCHDYAKQIEVLEALQEAVRNGSIPVDRVNQSLYRVLKLKEKYNLSDNTKEVPDVQYLNKKSQDIFRDYPSLRK